jgi:hypothetical protein
MRGILYIVVTSTGTMGDTLPNYLPKNSCHVIILPYGNAIYQNGTDEILTDGHNIRIANQCVFVAYEGGSDKKGHSIDTRTPQQTNSLITILKQYVKLFPDAKIVGENDLDKKCQKPGFNVSNWLNTINLYEND